MLPGAIGNGFLSEFSLEKGLNVAFGEMELNDKVEFIDNAGDSKSSITIFFK